MIVSIFFISHVIIFNDCIILKRTLLLLVLSRSSIFHISSLDTDVE